MLRFPLFFGEEEEEEESGSLILSIKGKVQ